MLTVAVLVAFVCPFDVPLASLRRRNGLTWGTARGKTLVGSVAADTSCHLRILSDQRYAPLKVVRKVVGLTKTTVV